MADYKELLRRAVQALPENNGQARRAVYEKARAALVGQLRAIAPPLAARDITTHRLQLEDCIRQVEQEASEAVIAGMQEPPPPPAKIQTTQAPRLETRAAGKPQPAPSEPPVSDGPEPGTIEAIIAAAEQATVPQPVAVKTVAASKVAPKAEPKAAARIETKPLLRVQPKPEEPKEEVRPEPKSSPRPNGKAGRPLPSIVARAEAAKGKSSTAFAIPPDKPYDGGRRSPTIEPRREAGPRLEPAMRGQAAARQQVAEPMAYIEEPSVVAAMSSVREVDVEPAIPVDPQGAIDRAIATLDREARGEVAPATNGKIVEMPMAEPEALPASRKGGIGGMFGDRQRRGERPERAERKAPGRRDQRAPRRDQSRAAEAAFQRPPVEPERGGISAVTIFLSVFAVLLVGAGGAGVWAWREGYLSLDALFARGETTQQQAALPETDLAVVSPAPEQTATGPGNTAVTEPVVADAAPKVEERLVPVEPAPAPAPTPDATLAEPLPLVAVEEPKTEERLPGADGTGQQAELGPAPSIDPATTAGSQSLLLEASDNGTTGAVPFSGTVDWSKGVDETGAPTLIGKASIPARNLGVDVLIRKNSDLSLPASHLMEINFTVAETFIGGSVAGLPGVLLKNEELVQGAPLVGASARVVGNTFLFALSASPEDSAANNELLMTRKWIDLAIIYATGKRAIITLEKDDAAEAMFREVFAAWGATASAQ